MQGSELLWRGAVLGGRREGAASPGKPAAPKPAAERVGCRLRTPGAARPRAVSWLRPLQAEPWTHCARHPSRWRGRTGGNTGALGRLAAQSGGPEEAAAGRNRAARGGRSVKSHCVPGPACASRWLGAPGWRAGVLSLPGHRGQRTHTMQPPNTKLSFILVRRQKNVQLQESSSKQRLNMSKKV